MANRNDALTVDADGHVLEPRDTWQKYLEPQFRADAIRIEKDASGVEVLLVENKVHTALRGTLGSLGGIEMPMVPGDWTQAGAINFFFTPAGPDIPPAGAAVRCGYALVLVWTIGPDGPSTLPGNTTVPACFSTGFIDFPAVGADGVVLPFAGHRGDHDGDHRLLRLGLAVAFGVVGAVVVWAGAAAARRR